MLSNLSTTISGFLSGAAVVAAVVAFLAILLVAIPWLFIWSVGVLFGHPVPLSIGTWFAAMVFLTLVRPRKDE